MYNEERWQFLVWLFGQQHNSIQRTVYNIQYNIHKLCLKGQGPLNQVYYKHPQSGSYIDIIFAYFAQ